MIVPSTARIRSASGKNEVSSSLNVCANGTCARSLGSFGASFGLMIARAIT